MNNALDQARALRRLADSDDGSVGAQPIIGAVVSCCLALQSAGEPKAALELADVFLARFQHAPSEWRLRLTILRLRALTAVFRDSEALALIHQIRAEFSDLLSVRAEDRAQLGIWEATALWHMNRAAEAVLILEALRSELLAAPDSATLAWCVTQLSSAEWVRGELHRARAYALEAVVTARRAGDRWLEGMALGNMAMYERQRCRWQTGEDYARESLDIFRGEGHRTQICHALRALGLGAWKRGRLGEALKLADDSLGYAREVGHDLFVWYGSLLKGMVLQHRGEIDAARSLFTSVEAWSVPDAHSRASLLTTEFLGDIHLEQGEAEQALRHYDEVWPKALALVPKGDIVAELRRRRAECYLLMGHDQLAYDEAKAGLEHCRELGDRYEEAATYRVLALAAAAIGKPAEAKRWFEQGFAYYDDIETPYEWGKLWLAYGDWLSSPLAAEFADRKGALEACEAARDHFERMGAQAKLAEARARIARIAPPATSTIAAAATTAPARPRPLRRPREQRELDARSKWALDTFGLVTRNRQVLALLDDVAKLARSMTPVLILGESGTGKELIAQGIHRLSARKGAFMPINCGALPREIIESELFGHVAGAFTGATRDKAGLFEVCDHGTAFLDEIAEMSQELQSRLLRYLETGEVRRVGATRHQSVSTRLLAATNRERATLEKGEGFRTDLYYRLAHAVVTLPPLRRRGDDVELLVEHFLAEANREEGKRVDFAEAATEKLVTYSWPGNVRQMRAVIRRIVILAHDGAAVTPEQLELTDNTSVATTLLEELEQAERRRVEEALKSARGSRTEAAKLLGMPRTTFINKLKRYGLMK